MSTQSNVAIKVNFSGDISYLQEFSVSSNTQSPAVIAVVNLTNGFNEIAVPSTNFVYRGVTIIPPVSNTYALTLKGVTGDVGVGINSNQPTFLSLRTNVTNIGVTAQSTVSGMRFIWV